MIKQTFANTALIFLLTSMACQISAMEQTQESIINLQTNTGELVFLNLSRVPTALGMALLAKPYCEVTAAANQSMQVIPIPFDKKTLATTIVLLEALEQNKSYDEIKKLLPKPLSANTIATIAKINISTEETSPLNKLAKAAYYLDIPEFKDVIKQRWKELTTPPNPAFMNIVYNAGWYIMPFMSLDVDDPVVRQVHLKALSESLHKNINQQQQSSLDDVDIDTVSSDQFIICHSQDFQPTSHIDVYETKSKSHSTLKKSFTIDGEIFHAKISTDDTQVAVKSEDAHTVGCTIYSLKTGTILKKLATPKIPNPESNEYIENDCDIQSNGLIAWLNDGKWIARTDFMNSKIYVWDLASDELIKELILPMEDQNEQIIGIMFFGWSDNHRLLLVGFDNGEIRIYNEAFDMIHMNHEPLNDLRDARWSANHKHVIISYKNKVVRCDHNLSYVQYYMPHHKDFTIMCADLSPDETYMAIALRRQDYQKRPTFVTVELWTMDGKHIAHITIPCEHKNIGGDLPVRLKWLSAHLLAVSLGPDVHIVNRAQFESHTNNSFKELIDLKISQ